MLPQCSLVALSAIVAGATTSTHCDVVHVRVTSSRHWLLEVDATVVLLKVQLLAEGLQVLLPSWGHECGGEYSTGMPV